MPDSLQKNECPSREQLSAYFDRESKHPEIIEKHLKQCPACRAYLETLSKIEYSMKHAIRQETGSDAEISKRILKGVQSSIRKKEQPSFTRFFPKPVVWRAAVLLMLGCSVGYLLWEEMRETKMEKQKENNPVQNSATVPAALTSTGRAVQVEELEEINFVADTSNTVFAEGKAPVAIKSYVKHCWEVSEKAEPVLADILKKSGIQSKMLTKNEDGWLLKVSMTKMQAAQFVKACSEAGFQLMSPEPPQPDQSFFTGQADDVIKYSADFIQKSAK